MIEDERALGVTEELEEAPASLYADYKFVTKAELEQLGLIQRESDPDDGRASILSPTAHGLARLAQARAPQEDTLAKALAGWPVDDIQNLTRLLHALTTSSLPG